jgi:hypothetical protein
MKADEIRHALEAQSAGAAELPATIKGLMRVASWGDDCCGASGLVVYFLSAWVT